MKYLAGHIVIIFTTVLLVGMGSVSASDRVPGNKQVPANGQIVLERIAPQGNRGQGYKLVYLVKVPIAVFWRFKTDFDNAFLVDNKYIRDHRFISQDGHMVITENKYTYGPDVFFRWRTKLSPKRFRLDFVLLNPRQCQQKYHHGYIQLASQGETTRVAQVAYFDFWGASFWAYYPWKGGMKDFLSYTARWEQETALRLKDRYHEKANPEK